MYLVNDQSPWNLEILMPGSQVASLMIWFTALIETDHTISLAFKAFHNDTQFKERFRCKQSLLLNWKYAMIKLNPAFHMITTIAVIAAIAEKKKRSQRSVAIIWNHSQAIAATTIAGDRCRCDRWRVVSIWSLNFFFSAIAAITAIVASNHYGKRAY